MTMPMMTMLMMVSMAMSMMMMPMITMVMMTVTMAMLMAMLMMTMMMMTMAYRGSVAILAQACLTQVLLARFADHEYPAPSAGQAGHDPGVRSRSAA